MARAVVFDGYCHVCSGWVRFMKKHRVEPPFELLPMQSERGRELWSRLEKMVGKDHMGKLIFLFALVPGPPYLIKLYLPLAMGVSRKLFFWCSASAHLVGVALFVGLGRALLEGNELLISIFVLALAILFVGLRVIQRKQSGEKEQREAEQGA